MIPLAQLTSDGADSVTIETETRDGGTEEGDQDSGTDTLQDSDAEQDDQEAKALKDGLDMHGWNVST